jgi:hypothetical protein
MADEVEVDYASVRAAADEVERIPADFGVTSLWLDYDGDFGHEALQGGAGSFLARWQGGGHQIERAHTGVAIDLRETAASMEFIDGLVDKGFGFFTDLLDGDG